MLRRVPAFFFLYVRGILMANYRSEKTKRLALAAVFAALAFLVALIPAPKVQFLSFDIKDTVIATASLILGPSVALSLSVVVPLLEGSVHGFATGPWGLLMDVVSTLSFALTASLIYKVRRTLGGAVLSLISSAAVQVAMMMVANILITPLYTGAPRQAVIGMLLPLLFPFNTVKSIFNAALVMLLYKPTTEALRRARILGGKSYGAGQAGASGYRFGGRTLIVGLLSLLVLIGAALVLFITLGAAWEGAS